jgi:hypothetical protein
MTGQWVCGIAAAGCSAGSCVPYAAQTVRGTARPSPLSWVIWLALCAQFTAALAAGGGRHAHWRITAPLGLPAAETAGAAVILVLAVRQQRRSPGGAADDKLPRPAVVALLAGCAAALAGWWLAGPAVAACLLIAVDFAGAVPTVRKLRRDPGSEALGSWWGYAAGECFSVAAATGAGWVFWASPISGAAVAALIIGTAWAGGARARVPRLPALTPVARLAAMGAAAAVVAAAVQTAAQLTAPPARHLAPRQPPGPLPVVLAAAPVPSPRPLPPPSPHR